MELIFFEGFVTLTSSRNLIVEEKIKTKQYRHTTNLWGDLLKYFDPTLFNMPDQLNTENLIQPMTNAVSAALEQSRTTLSGIESFMKLDKETALDQTFRFNHWLADFEQQVAADFPTATAEKKSSLLLRHLDHTFQKEIRAETLATTGADNYANYLITVKNVICLENPEREARRAFYAFLPHPNESPDSIIKRLTISAAPCNFGETKDEEIMKQCLAKISNDRWQIRADTENWDHKSLQAGKTYAKKLVALRSRLNNLKETYGRGSGNAVNAIQDTQQNITQQQIPESQPQLRPNNGKQPCPLCNYRHSQEGPCFANRMQCYGCGEYGHLIARCTNPKPPQLQQYQPQATGPNQYRYQKPANNTHFQARNFGYGQPPRPRPQQQSYGYPRNPQPGQGHGFGQPRPYGYQPNGPQGYRPTGFQQRFRQPNFGNRGRPGRVNAIDSDPTLEYSCECQHDYTGFDQASGYDPSLEQPTGYDYHQENEHGYEPQPDYPQQQPQSQENHQSTTSHHQETQQEIEQPLDSFYQGVKGITLVEDDL